MDTLISSLAKLCKASSQNYDRSSLLPPQSREDRRKNKKTLVLDIDGTLVYAKAIMKPQNVPASELATPRGYRTMRYPDVLEENLKGQQQKKKSKKAPKEEKVRDAFLIHVKPRPGAKELMKELKDLYEIVIFSAAWEKYVEMVMKELDPDGTIVPKTHILCRDSCDWGPNSAKDVRKDLSKLGRDMAKVIMVDDSSSVFSPSHLSNVILVSNFSDSSKNPTNDVLCHLRVFLQQIAAVDEDVRGLIPDFNPLPLTSHRR